MKVNRVNLGFFTLTPVLALLGCGWYAWHYGIGRVEIGLFAGMYAATVLAITAGYHRYYTHGSYECSRALQLFYLFFGAAAVESSVLKWASDHRLHHRHADTDRDPHNVLRGGFYAHLLWMIREEPRALADRFENVPDLLRDPFIVWQHRHYVALVVAGGFVLPMAAGAVFGHALGGLLFGGLLRCVVVQHVTFLINSLAHMQGSRPYSGQGTARDNWWLGILAFGEGYHNFHHKFPGDYRNGIRWHQLDVCKWWLRTMGLLGQAWDFRKTPEPLIAKALREAAGTIRKIQAAELAAA